MNYTENYHLPQWVKEDRIMMDDFNQMCLDMEHGLAQTAVDAAAGTAKAAASAAAAQATADKAVADAAAAQATADVAYCPTNQPYVLGTYLSDGKEQTITLGFQPKFLLISSVDSHAAYDHTLPAWSGIETEWLEILPTGFKVKVNVHGGSSGSVQSPVINSTNNQYAYIAFR